MRGLQDKVAVITGAAGGIGRALVRRFCEEGSRVVCLDSGRVVETGGVELLDGVRADVLA